MNGLLKIDQDGEFGRLASTQRLTLRGLVFLLGLGGLCAGVGGATRALLDDTSEPYTGTAVVTERRQLGQWLAQTGGEFDLVSLERDRTNAIFDLSVRFGVPTHLATVIYDAALSEGVAPELAFRLVRVESNFNPRARSSAQAIGLAQVQLPTARHYQPRITEIQLFEPQRNLRIGFRYLHDLSEQYGDNMRLALLAYNVGPARLNDILEGGKNPRGRYASTVLKGYSYRPPSE